GGAVEVQLLVEQARLVAVDDELALLRREAVLGLAHRQGELAAFLAVEDVLAGAQAAQRLAVGAAQLGAGRRAEVRRAAEDVRLFAARLGDGVNEAEVVRRRLE